MSEVEVSPKTGPNGQPHVATAQLSVADVVGATIAAQGVHDAFGVIGSGNLVVTNALCRGGAQFHPRPARDERDVHGRWLRARQRSRRRGERAPGAGPDQHHDRPGRGGQEPDADSGSRGRDARRRADVELPDRPARSGRVGGRDRRPRSQRQDRRRRRRPGLPASGHRAPPGRADAADRHSAPTRRPDRAVQTAPAPAPAARTAGRGDRSRSRAPQDREASGHHRRPRRRARRRRPKPRAAWRDRRRDPGHLGAGQRPVRRPPLRPRNLRRVRQPVRRHPAASGRRRAGGRRLGQPLDDQARRSDRLGRQGDPGRPRAERDRPQPPRRPGHRGRRQGNDHEH